VIQVPAGVHVDVPLQVLFLSSVGSSPTASYPRLLVSVGDGATLHLKQSYASVKIDGSGLEEESLIVIDEVTGLDNVNEGGASMTVEVEDKKSVPTLVTANTRIVLGRGGSKMKHTYTQESAGERYITFFHPIAVSLLNLLTSHNLSE
jgi:Fe-S cluster assembly scaffold protein SufB